MAQRKVNWFAVWTSVAVVVAIIVVAAVVVVMNNAADDPVEPPVAPEGSSVNFETGAISVGDGPNVIATYIDFMCPICGQFEAIYGPTIEELVTDGSATLEIHPISILNRASQGTEFSTRSANAMYCVAVAEPEASLPFLQAMFANQPEEGTPGLTDEQMIAIAAGVGATGIDECVTGGEYSDYVDSMTGETPVAPGAGGIGTPTVLLNGEFVSLTGDPQADLVAALQ